MTKKEQKYIKSLKDENDGLRSLLIRFMDAVGKLTNIDDVVNMSLIPIMTEKTKRFKAEFKAEAYKECIEKVNNIIDEIYNKHIFGSNDLSDEEKDAVINFSDDVTYKLDNLLNELVNNNQK